MQGGYLWAYDLEMATGVPFEFVTRFILSTWSIRTSPATLHALVYGSVRPRWLNRTACRLQMVSSAPGGHHGLLDVPSQKGRGLATPHEETSKGLRFPVGY